MELTFYFTTVCLSTNFLNIPSFMDINSLYVPLSTVFPLLRTMILLADCIVDKRCAIIRTVFPTMRRSKASCTRYSLSASKALTKVESYL